ncbi:MAG: DUF192 domain-containing protein [Planctomycetota bacterium]
MDYSLSRGGEPWVRAAERSDFLGRLIGWMGQAREGLRDQALWFPDCRSLQTTFMRFPLDVYFLDGSRRVIRRCLDVGSFRLVSCPSADSALELPAGSCRRLNEGEVLEFRKCA